MIGQSLNKQDFRMCLNFRIILGEVLPDNPENLVYLVDYS